MTVENVPSEANPAHRQADAACRDCLPARPGFHAEGRQLSRFALAGACAGAEGQMPWSSVTRACILPAWKHAACPDRQPVPLRQRGVERMNRRNLLLSAGAVAMAGATAKPRRRGRRDRHRRDLPDDRQRRADRQRRQGGAGGDRRHHQRQPRADPHADGPGRRPAGARRGEAAGDHGRPPERPAEGPRRGRAPDHPGTSAGADRQLHLGHRRHHQPGGRALRSALPVDGQFLAAACTGAA